MTVYNSLTNLKLELCQKAYESVREEDEESVRRFIAENGINNNPMMHYAASLGSSKMISVLYDLNMDVNASLDGLKPIHLTVEKEALRILLSRGADVNAREAEDGVTPLIALCRAHHLEPIKRQEAINFLLMSGAQTDCKDHRGWTARAHALVRNLDVEASLLPEDSYTKELIYRTLIAHVNSLDEWSSLEDKVIKLLGMPSVHLICKEMACSLKTFSCEELTLENKETLVDAFKKASVRRSKEELLESIKTDALTVIPVHTVRKELREAHQMMAVFSNHQLFFCETSGSGVPIYKFHYENPTLILDCFKKHEKGSYRELVGALHSLPGVKRVEEEAVKEISPHCQTAENCAFKSAKTALRVGVECLQPGGSSVLISKLWSLHHRLDGLESYFDFHDQVNDCQMDLHLVEMALNKISDHLCEKNSHEDKARVQRIMEHFSSIQDLKQSDDSDSGEDEINHFLCSIND